MTTSIKKRKAQTGLPRKLAGVKPVAMGCAVLMLASGAYAQDAQPQQPQTNQLDTVVVTGIRKGIEDAIATKRNNDGVSETISAEDIGKLPDTTIADSLARLPGVTTQRTADGQASTISIRGLGPDFNGYLLNGREQSSTGDSRAVDLSVYPSELIGSATVYKTSDASLPAAGLAGTLDTRLVDPLAFPKRTLAATYQDVRNSIGLTSSGVPSGTGHRKSLTYIDQFADRTVGVALGYVRVDGTTGSSANGGWGNSTSTVTTTNGTVMNNVQLPSTIFNGGGLSYETDTSTDNRNGFAGILNWKPNKSFNTELDYYRARIKDLKQTAAWKFPESGSTTITNATVTGNVATAGTFNLGANPNGLVDYAESVFDDDTINSVGWRMNFQLNPTWKMSSDISHNSAKRIERDINAYAGIPSADTLSYTTSGSGVPQFSLGSPASYTNPSIITLRDQTGWSGTNYVGGPYDGMAVPQDGYDKGPTITDTVTALRMDFTHDLAEGSAFSSVQFGVNYTERTKNRVGVEALIVPSTINYAAGNPAPFPSSTFIASNVGGTGLNMLSFTPSADLWSGVALQSKYNDDILSKTWEVFEKVTTAYIKGNIDTEWAGIPVRGNVGVQLVQTDQYSSGYQANIGSGVTLANPTVSQSLNGVSYVDVLPSLNLTGDFGNGKLLRFGLSEQIARNDMTDMRNSVALSYVATQTTPSGGSGELVGSAGNPYLKPFKATALDLSFEKYFNNKAYLSAAVFYKNLQSYTVPYSNPSYDFTAMAHQLGVIPSSGSYSGLYTSNVNGSGGNLKGFELAASVPFNLMTRYLDGLGASASYSVTGSSVQLPNLIGLVPTSVVPASGTIGLPGLSTRNAKAMLYFEKWGFSAFVADNYRSTFIGSVPAATGGYPTLQYIKGSSWVSAQVGYEVQSGYLKGLAVRFEGNNMNDPVYTQLNGDGSINSQNKTGHQYILMFSYKYE